MKRYGIDIRFICLIFVAIFAYYSHLFFSVIIVPPLSEFFDQFVFLEGWGVAILPGFVPSILVALLVGTPLGFFFERLWFFRALLVSFLFVSLGVLGSPVELWLYWPYAVLAGVDKLVFVLLFVLFSWGGSFLKASKGKERVKVK